MHNYYMTAYMTVWFICVIIYNTRHFKKFDYEFLAYAILGILICICIDTLTAGMWELEEKIKYLKSLDDDEF